MQCDYSHKVLEARQADQGFACKIVGFSCNQEQRLGTGLLGRWGRFGFLTLRQTDVEAERGSFKEDSL